VMAHRTSARSSGQPGLHQSPAVHWLHCRIIQEIAQVLSKLQQQVGKVRIHKQLWCDDCVQEGLFFAYKPALHTQLRCNQSACLVACCTNCGLCTLEASSALSDERGASCNTSDVLKHDRSVDQ
jgi:hypothetical protein